MGVASDRNSGPQPLAIAVSCRGPVGPRRNHDDRMPVGGCLVQNRLELLRGGDVDLGGRRRHGQAVDHRGIPDARHLGLTSHGDAIAGK